MALLGSRHAYQYLSDNGNKYVVTTLDYLADAAQLSLADGTELGPLPRRWKPRILHASAKDATTGKVFRKKVICQANNALFTSNALDTIQFGGQDWAVTGRRGEVRTLET